MSVADDLIADARGFATSATSAAVGSLNAAMALIDNLGNTIGGGAPPEFNVVVPDPTAVGTLPVYDGPHFKSTLFRGVRPTLANVSALVLPADPRAAPEAIDYNAPVTPNGEPNFAALLAVPTIQTSFPLPTAPDMVGEIRGIAVPVLTPITIRAAPTYQPPEFLGVRPDAAPDAPTDLDVTMRTQYATISPVMRDAVAAEFDAFLDREFPDFRTGMAAIEDRLATYLAGGSALSATVENAIYNRTLDKTNADAVRASRKAYGEAAKRGMTLVGPAIAAQLLDLDQARRDNNARAAIDIAIKQAELEQNNLQFAVTQSSNLRNVALNAANAFYSGLVQINGQALDYARHVVDSIVKAYDIAAKHSEIQARVYEAEGRIYEGKLKGALAVYEAYSAEMRGLEAQANVDTARVQAYKVRIDAVIAEANVYRAQVEAVAVAANIEKLKVELYEARVRGVAAETNMYTARWQGYEAAVRGEAAKQQASAEQLRGYQAEVQAYAAVVDARAKAIEGATRANESKIKAYAVDVESYAALNKAESEAVQAEIMSYDSTLKAYMAATHANAEHDRARIAGYEVALRSIIAQAELYMEQTREVNKLDIARVTGATSVAGQIGQVYSGVAQAAMSGMNSLAANIVTESA